MQTEPGVSGSPPRLITLLQDAAKAGDREAFYKYFTAPGGNEGERAVLAEALGQLARSCESVGDWPGAADAYHHALRLQPQNDSWKSAYLRLRRLAPEWGFYSLSPKRVWKLADYPDAATQGLVAPIRSLVFGWLPDRADDAGVIFKLNGIEIADTHATTPVTLPDGHKYLRFSRSLKDLWKFAGAGDRLTVESRGRRLTIIGRGEAFEFTRNESRSTELATMLHNGFVFNKYGRVNRSIQVNDQWQVGIFDLYARLRHDLADALELALFPFYGTMLGAVREHDFIEHDNDFDTIYISEHSDPKRVREEFKHLCHVLLTRGYDLKVKPTHTWVRLPGTPDKLDIFFAWFDDDDRFDVSYGFHGPQLAKSADFFRFRSERLGKFDIPVPVNVEAILVQLYGHSWRVPDSGFQHSSASLNIDGRYHLDTNDVTELHWSQFYRDNHPSNASPFADFVAHQFGPPGLLVEFGCGNGRDTLFFASRGWTALACDRSPEAIAQAQGAVQAKGAPPVRLTVVDVSSPGDITDFLDSNRHLVAQADPLVVYMRFFLHAIDEHAQDVLLNTLGAAIQRPFYLCAEFRTPADRDLTKAYGAHYRRYIDHESLCTHLRDRWGYEIEHVEAGRGLSPYDGEDPHVARIIARQLGSGLHRPQE